MYGCWKVAAVTEASHMWGHSVQFQICLLVDLWRGKQSFDLKTHPFEKKIPLWHHLVPSLMPSNRIELKWGASFSQVPPCFPAISWHRHAIPTLCVEVNYSQIFAVCYRVYSCNVYRQSPQTTDLCNIAWIETFIQRKKKKKGQCGGAAVGEAWCGGGNTAPARFCCHW